MHAAVKALCLCLSVGAHGAALWAMTSGEAPRGAGAGEATGAPSVLTFVSPAAAQALVQAWETPPDIAPAPAAIQAPPSPAAAPPRLPPPRLPPTAPALPAPPPTARAMPVPLAVPPSPEADLLAIAPPPAPPSAEAAPRRSLRPAARDPQVAESAESAETASAPPRDTAGPARAPRQPPSPGTAAAASAPAGAAPGEPTGGGGPSAAAAAGLRDSWAGAIRSAIARVHQVPQAAIRQGLSGRVVLRVEVAPDGRVAGVGYVERSGSAVLDDAAMATLRRARLPPAPGGVSGAVTVDVPLRFTVR